MILDSDLYWLGFVQKKRNKKRKKNIHTNKGRKKKKKTEIEKGGTRHLRHTRQKCACLEEGGFGCLHWFSNIWC